MQWTGYCSGHRITWEAELPVKGIVMLQHVHRLAILVCIYNVNRNSLAIPLRGHCSLGGYTSPHCFCGSSGSNSNATLENQHQDVEWHSQTLGPWECRQVWKWQQIFLPTRDKINCITFHFAKERYAVFFFFVHCIFSHSGMFQFFKQFSKSVINS